MSSDLYNQIINDRGSFERMVARLPGFAGYLDRAARRTADRLLRDQLAYEVDQRIKRLALIERRLLDKTGLQYTGRTSSAKTKLQTYHDRIKAAAPGYSGFFEAIKIDAEELDLLYGFDELQFVYVDRISGALDALEAATDAGQGVDEAIDSLDALAREANDAFSERERKLLNLDASLTG